MKREKELKLLKIIDRIAEEVQMIGQTLDGIEGVMTCARNSKLELLQIGQLLSLEQEKKEQEKKEQEKKEQEKKEQEKKDGDKKIIRHKDEGQTV